MKKTILIFLILTGIGGAWWIYSSRSSSTVVEITEAPAITPEAVLEEDYQKIAVHLKKENIVGTEWEKINTYSIPPQDLVEKDNAANFLKVAQKNIPDIYACLRKDFCGMTTRGEDDAYFDEERTPAHILINRNLKIIKESLIKDPSLSSKVDWELMNELARANSEMLSVEAVDIIRQFDKGAVKTDELLKLTKDYKGDAKAEALERIAQKGTASDKVLLSRDIEETFAMADANTVISVLEKLKMMSLSPSDTSRVLRNLCRFKNGDESHNWPMVKFQANKLDSNFETYCN